VNQPQRGEVMVFRFPDDPSLDYIKRVIGVPGDKVEYRNKQLTINGEPAKLDANGTFHYVEDKLNYVNTKLYLENLNNHIHAILINPEVPPVRVRGVQQFLYRDNCVYNDSGFSCTVPAGYYFMLGDNRDSSNDSRYWGFVPEENIVGKAFFIWWNWADFVSFEFKRIGQTIK
jgi:signal peptidase I